MDKVHQSMWIELPKHLREYLIQIFGIVKTGIAEVRDQTLISDGITTKDLSVISMEKMAEYVGAIPENSTFSKLWDLTVSKAKFELQPEISSIRATAVLPKLPFCDSCDSKGVVHKKECPKRI